MEAGIYHTLTVARITGHGLYLTNEDGEEVLLPNRYVSLSDKVGDEKEVFVYHDSENRLVATTERSLARVGEAAYLKIVDKNIHGAFLDWGLTGKHLFIPNRNQTGLMEGGKSYVVYIYRDNVTGRAVATSRLGGFITNENITVSVKEPVAILVAQQTPLGFRVIINDRHWGMIYNNQIFRPVAVGDRLKGFVNRITDDSRIDVSLSQEGYDGVKRAADTLLELLKFNNGELPLGDDSDPTEVGRLTRMSKKMFKRAAGYLLKAGLVELGSHSMRLMHAKE